MPRTPLLAGGLQSAVHMCSCLPLSSKTPGAGAALLVWIGMSTLRGGQQSGGSFTHPRLVWEERPVGRW